MQIKFKCPEGHQLSAGQDRAGKPGKCPKCGTRFVVPAGGDPSDTPAATPAAVTEATFAFLCPNGHELNGPVSLRGRPGQCPHCNEKFLIPVQDADEEDEPADHDDIPTGVIEDDSLPPAATAGPPSTSGDAVPVGMIVEVAAEEILLEEDDDLPFGELDDDDEEEDHEEVDVANLDLFEQQPVQAEIAGNSVVQSAGELRQLIRWMWDRKGSDEPIEIVLREGSAFLATHFSDKLSDGNFGVFAEKKEDSKFTITTIAWDAMARIALHNVKRLPDNDFR